MKRSTSHRVMQPEGAPRPSNRLGLRVRLLVFVALALSPILILGAIQAHLDYTSQQAALHDRLTTTALMVAREQEVAFRSAGQLLTALQRLPEVRRGGAACQTVLSEAIRELPAYATVSMLNAEGEFDCGSLPPPAGISVTERDWFRAVRDGDRFVVGEYGVGAVSGEPVMIVAVPRTPLEPFSGVAVIGVRVAHLQTIGASAQLPPGSYSGLVDSTGRVVTDRYNLEMARISPARLAEASESGGAIVYQRSESRDRLLAIAPLVENDVFVLLSAPQDTFRDWQAANVTGTLLLPFAMWLLALTAVWIATDQLILRWLTYLGRIARAYGHGRYSVKPTRAGTAPREIRELAETFQWMAERIAERDDELIDAVEQKQVLIKENHHRVKNNLQIITSLINLQANSVQDPAGISVLREAQARINALALVHRTLYEAEDLRFIQLGSFLRELCRLSHAAGGGDESGLSLDFEDELGDLLIGPDRAIPIALFVTEAMTNAYKHAFQGRRSGRLTVCLRRRTGKAGDRLIEAAVADDGVGLSEEARHRGVGSSLFEAFAMQLEGETETRSNPEGGLTVLLRLPLGEDEE